MKSSIDRKDPVLFRMFERHSDLVLIFHVDGSFIFANQRAHEVLNITNDLKKEAILADNFDQQIESFTTEVVTDDKGEPCYTLCFAKELGDRISQEQKIINIHKTISATPSCLKIVSKKGKLLDMNPQGLDLIEAKSLDSVLNASVYDLVTPEFRETFKKFNARICSGEKGTLIFQITGLKGTLRWMETFAAPFRLSSGEMAHIAITNDISERVKIEQEYAAQMEIAKESAKLAQKAEAAKSEFLANMSHEIRTPMNGVLGMVQILRETSLDEEQKNMLEVISSSGMTLMNIINDVLDFSKIEAGKVELESVSFNLKKLLHEAIRLMEHVAEQKEIKLYVEESSESDQYFSGDETRVKQIVLNYLTNALKFTSEGEVKLSTKVEPSDKDNFLNVSIYVTDTGIGIKKENQHKLFKAFTQADASTTRKFGGTGLGLSICNSLAKLLGGSVGFSSEEGKGSEFSLHIPLAKCEGSIDKSNTPISIKDWKKSNLKVLLVEDNKINQKIVVMMLKKFGICCDVADNGKVALSKLAEETYPLIFMDMQMPVMDGLEATSEIIAKYGEKAPPIVAMTANAFAEDKEKCFATGMVDFLVKPVDKNDLEAVLKKYLASHLKKEIS